MSELESFVLFGRVVMIQSKKSFVKMSDLRRNKTLQKENYNFDKLAEHISIICGAGIFEKIEYVRGTGKLRFFL